MSSRPRDAKKVRRLRKALRNTPPSYIDLVAYLRQHRYAQTAGAARRLLTEGKVMVDSHPVGRFRVSPDADWQADPWLPARHRESIVVLTGIGAAVADGIAAVEAQSA